MAGDGLDFKKRDRALYLPGDEPVTVGVPSMTFLWVDGAGAPESEDYQQAVEVLYGLTFTIKMNRTGPDCPPDYYAYVVPPLEGLWAGSGEGFSLDDRDGWTWSSLIRQPEFVTPEVFAWAVGECRRKKPGLAVERAKLVRWEEGFCVQLMHHGPFATEPATVAKLARYLQNKGLRDETGPVRRHHEIYLSDPRRTSPDKMRTVLRHPVGPAPDIS